MNLLEKWKKTKDPIETALENAINQISRALVYLIVHFAKWAFPPLKKYKKMGFWVTIDHIVFYYIVIRSLQALWKLWFPF